MYVKMLEIKLFFTDPCSYNTHFFSSGWTQKVSTSQVFKLYNSEDIHERTDDSATAEIILKKLLPKNRNHFP